jgi:hypothetical protein
MMNSMGTFNIGSLLILTLLFTYSNGHLPPFVCSQCAKPFTNFEAYEKHFGKAPDKHHTRGDYWHRYVRILPVGYDSDYE